MAQVWAGNGWGAFFWPRIGHEVVVTFEEGDPDQPVIVGSVYNAENMPPLLLPSWEMVCGIKSASVRGNANENFNGITFVDVKGKEHLAIHSERHMMLHAEYDVAGQIGRHHFQRVPGAHMVSVGSLPGMGGSGGGPAQPSVNLPGGGSGGAPSNVLGTVSGTPWAVPQPQAVLGLSSSVVYGSYFQSTWPLSTQLAHGSLIKIILDPTGFELAFPESGGPMAAASLGLSTMPGVTSGANGNLQLTLGNSANIMMGRTYNVHLGPKTTTVEANDESGDTIMSPALGALLGMVAILFQESYALLGVSSSSTVNDDVRGVLVMGFQAAAQLLFGHLLSSAVAWRITDINKKLVQLKGHGTTDLKTPQELQDELEDLTSLQAWSPFDTNLVIAGLVIPTLVDCMSEAALSQTSGLP